MVLRLLCRLLDSVAVILTVWALAMATTCMVLIQHQHLAEVTGPMLDPVRGPKQAAGAGS